MSRSRLQGRHVLKVRAVRQVAGSLMLCVVVFLPLATFSGSIFVQATSVGAMVCSFAGAYFWTRSSIVAEADSLHVVWGKIFAGDIHHTVPVNIFKGGQPTTKRLVLVTSRDNIGTTTYNFKHAEPTVVEASKAMEVKPRRFIEIEMDNMTSYGRSVIRLWLLQHEIPCAGKIW
jgi:hypothetical protein